MGLMKKMASVVVTGSLLFGLVGTAMAAPAADPVAAAAAKLQALGIVNGLPGGDLGLDQTITRAQLTKTLVWAFGKKDDAALLAGANAFPDTATNWASGEIAIAKAIAAKNGIDLGRPGGIFAPQATVTNAEVVAFMAKFIGVQPDNSLTWPDNYLSAAVKAGLITNADVAVIKPIANAPATRGEVFFLADEAFQANLGNGKSVYTTYVKTSAPSLTVDAVDASTTADSITVTGTVSSDATTVYVGSTSNKAAINNGKFSATVSLSLGSNDLTVGAVDLAGNVTTKPLTVTRTVGAAASVAAPASITATAGQTVDFAAAVKDAAGNKIADADVTVNSTLGSYAAGKFTAGTKAGTETATVTYGTFSVPVSITVNAGALSQVVVSPATVDVTTNNSQKFTATGADQYGNEVAISGVTWSASKGVIGNDGTFGATSDAAGTVTVTATANGFSGTATANVFGQAAKVTMAAPAAVVANGVSTSTVTATVVDANGNVAKGYNGPVVFASTDAEIAFAASSVQAVNGVASTTFTANATRTTVLTASAQGLTGATATLAPTAQAVSSVKVVASPTGLAATSGSTGDIALTLQDQTGNDMKALPANTTYTVTLTSSDASIAYFDANSATKAVTFDAVTKHATINATSKVGAVTVTGAVTAPAASTVAVNSVSVNTQIVGQAYQLTIDPVITTATAGTAQTATIRVRDFNGNQLTTGTLSNITVTRTDANGATTNLSTTLGATAGVATINVNTTAAGTYTLTASASGLVSAPAVSYTVTPASAVKVVLSKSIATLRADGTSQSVLTATVKDANNNVVTAGSYAVTFHKASGTGTGAFADQVVNTVNGVATATVTSTTNVSAGDVYTVTAQGLSGDSTSIATAIFGSAYKLGFGTITTNPVAGSTATVNVNVQDAAQVANTLTDDNGRTVTVTLTNHATGAAAGTFTGTTVNGVAAVPVSLTAAGQYDVAVASTGLVAPANSSVTFVAAAPASIALSADVTTLSAYATSASTITATLKDQYGNTATAGSALTVTLTAGATTYGSFASSSATAALSFGASDSSKSADFTANSGTGSTAITATATNLTSGSLTLNSIVTGNTTAAYQVGATTATAASDTVTANAPANYNAFTVTLVDGAGNRITNDTDAVYLTTSGNNGTVDAYYWNGTAWTAYTTGVAATKGQVKFAIADNKAETVNFTVANASSSATVTGTGSAAFVPGSASQIEVLAANPGTIAGNGSAVTTVSAQVEDALGNLVSTASGTMNFSIAAGNDYATLQSTTAPIVNGVATVVLQSKQVTNSGSVTVSASADVNGDGTAETDNANTALTIDAVAPTVSSTVAANAAGSAVGAAGLGVIGTGDTITVTFSEGTNQPTLNAGSFILPGLDTFGTGATFQWTSASTLVITLGDSPVLNAGDAVALVAGNTITDLAGNSFGTALFTVPAASNF